MTTVFGLRHPDVNVAILAGDRQGTYREKPEKTPTRKLFIGNSQDYAIGFSGAYSDPIIEIIQKIKEGKVDIEKIIAEGNFPELREINIASMGNTLPKSDDLGSFLLITRFKRDPKLFTCWPMGKVELRTRTHIGSGAKYIEEFISAVDVLNSINSRPKNKATVGSLIGYVLNGVKYAASKDLFSTGIDLVIATPECIRDHEKDLVDNNFSRKVKHIQRQYPV